jgi:DHA1 family inner membrane transport protein
MMSLSALHMSTSPKASGVVLPPHGLLIAMLTLGMGGLFIGTGEFASMSLLPDMAQSSGVSIPVAGSYISAYALGVVFGAPLIAALGARCERKTLLLMLLALATLGYLASAFAWGHLSLLMARFVSGLPHGAYYGVAALVASAMVSAQRRAQAIGYVMLGLAAANVIGVPAATWLGQTWGWRSAFGCVGLGCALTATMLMLFVPRVAAEAGVSALTELAGLKSLQLWLTLGVASIGFGGMFAVYSYITPTLTEVTGLALSSVPMALATWGMGMIVGNLVGGRLADRALIPAIFSMLVWNMVFLALFSVTASSPYWALVTLFLIGNGFALVPALQAHLMQAGGKAQTLAAALNHSAFNVSNAIGASLGGLAIAQGLGWASTGWVGGALAFAGLLVMVPAGILASRHSHMRTQEDA